MAMIIAARFSTFDQAEIAANQLIAEGVSADHLHTFFVNPPGSHGSYPIGGDNAYDPDSKGGSIGALAGAALIGIIGAGIGALIGYIFGSSTIGMIGGAGAGAYIGSLIGAMKMIGRKRSDRSPREQEADKAKGGRPSGVLLAVNVESDDQQLVGRILRNAGGQEVERAQGRWENGKWKDFDPMASPERD